MKRVNSDVQNLSDATTSVETTKRHHICITREELFIRWCFQSQRKCSCCHRLVKDGKNDEFLCDLPRCQQCVYFILCKVCVGEGVSTEQCPKGFGCQKNEKF